MWRRSFYYRFLLFSGCSTIAEATTTIRQIAAPRMRKKTTVIVTMAIVTIIAAITMLVTITAAAVVITITIVRLEDIVLHGLTMSERINLGLFFIGIYTVVFSSFFVPSLSIVELCLLDVPRIAVWVFGVEWNFRIGR